MLTGKEKTIHTQGLVGVLKELHDELDAAVLQAYGWTLRQAQGERGGATGERFGDELLTRLVALNAQRALEEKTGKVRWLRPEFQNLAFKASDKLLSNQELSARISYGLQADLMPENASKPIHNSKTTVQPWPATLPLQVSATAQLLASATTALSLPEIEASFKSKGPWKKGLPRILETLEALGRARREGEGWRAL